MPRIINIIIYILLLATPTLLVAHDDYPTDYLNPDNPDRKRYIERYRQIAIVEMERVGIPASIKLAQGILESNDGKSELAKKANNHFGIKCGKDWTGPTMFRKDDDHDVQGNLIESCFRVYDEAEGSYRDHSAFLADTKKKFRYGHLFQLPVTDYRAWAKGLQSSGYATNPNYANLLIGIIEANNLSEYDFMEAVEFEAELAQNDRSRRVTHNNGVKMIFAKAGEKLDDIAKEYKVKTSKLLKYNDLNKDISPLKDGERIYLQCKRKSFRGKKSYHIIKEGDTMYNLAQMYGLRLEKLYAKNRIPIGTEPAAGQRISLTSKVSRDEVPRLRGTNEKLMPFIPNIERFVTELLAKQLLPPPATTTPTTTSPTTPQQPPVIVVDDSPQPPVVIEQKFHTVTKGDTLYSISKKYGISVDAIKQLNNMTANDIKIDQKLRVQ